MSNPNVQPLAQDFTIAAQVPDPQRYFFHDPNLTRLDDGTLLIAAPEWERDRQGPVERRLRMLASPDGGANWEEGAPLPYQEGTPFRLDGQLLMFVQEESHRNFQIVRSADAGRNWTDPVTVIEAPVWNISTTLSCGAALRRIQHTSRRRLKSKVAAGTSPMGEAALPSLPPSLTVASPLLAWAPSTAAAVA